MKQKLTNRLVWILSILIISSCRKEINIPGKPNLDKENMEDNARTGRLGNTENDMVLYWNEKTAIVLGTHTNPGVDARRFAMVHIAIHDALNSIVPKYTTYALHGEKERKADLNAAIASAAYWTIKGLNIQGLFPIDAWYNESLATIEDGASKDQGKILGKKSADAIIQSRANDGFNQVVITSPFPLNGTVPGAYRSTLPASNPALNLPQLRNVPNWGVVVRPFLLQSSHQFRPPGPHAVNSSAYTDEYNEIKAKGALVGSTRTQEETDLKNFWSDMRQHIVWNSFTRKIIETKRLNAFKTAQLFALIHTAMADGATSMFEAIYHYYHWRPETAIRIADDGNPNTISDPNWLPSVLIRAAPNPLFNFYTPAVPEYPSTFSILGSITGKILQEYFQSDAISVQLTSSVLTGVSIQYNTISNAVRDNSISRIYAGWSFRKSAEDGEIQGRQIAMYALSNYFIEVE